MFDTRKDTRGSVSACFISMGMVSTQLTVESPLDDFSSPGSKGKLESWLEGVLSQSSSFSSFLELLLADGLGLGGAQCRNGRQRGERVHSRSKGSLGRPGRWTRRSCRSEGERRWSREVRAGKTAWKGMVEDIYRECSERMIEVDMGGRLISDSTKE